MVMRDVDIILATGGPGMVKAAYSSGKPALGVGAGNTPVVIDDTADVLLAVNSIIHSKTFDNGMICASEQSVTVIDTIYDQVKAEFQKRGCYFVKQGAEMEALRAAMFKNGALDHRIPGMAAAKIAELAGIEVPAKTKILIAEVTSTDPAKEEFSHEKLSPVLAIVPRQGLPGGRRQGRAPGARRWPGPHRLSVRAPRPGREDQPVRARHEGLPYRHQHPVLARRHR